MIVTDVIDVNTVKADSSHLYATMLVQGQQVKFQLDSGASCNVLPRHALKLHGTRLKRTEHVLSMYNKTVIIPAGRCSLDVVNPRSQEEFEIEFFVFDHPGAVLLLGSKTVQEMGLIHVNRDKILAVTTGMGKINNMAELADEFPDVFDGTGCLEGQYHLVLDDTARPVVHPPRRVPVAMRTKLEEELDSLTERQIIAPVDVPTPLVSSLVCVEKPNGKLRVCLDPKDLNKGLRRSHYPMPTIDDVLPDLNDAKVFSTFDAKNGFWHVDMDEESSYLTTFNTPYGRYRWQRMPFGLSTAPE